MDGNISSPALLALASMNDKCVSDVYKEKLSGREKPELRRVRPNTGVGYHDITFASIFDRQVVEVEHSGISY